MNYATLIQKADDNWQQNGPNRFAEPYEALELYLADKSICVQVKRYKKKPTDDELLRQLTKLLDENQEGLSLRRIQKQIHLAPPTIARLINLDPMIVVTQERPNKYVVRRIIL